MPLTAARRLDRQEFGLTGNAPLEGRGWLVGDEVRIAADVELLRGA